MRIARQNITPIVSFIFGSVVGVAVLGSVLSLGAFFSDQHMLFDLISHFRVQYIVLILPAFFIAIFAKKIYPVLIMSVALAVHGYAVAMTLLPEFVRLDTAYDEITVLNSNLFIGNNNYQAQLDIITKTDPDIIAFEEYGRAWHTVLSRSLELYPHRITHPEFGTFGIAIYSKYPIESGGLEHFADSAYPAISTVIQLTNTNVHVMAVHPPPPSAKQSYYVRNKTMQRIGLAASVRQTPVIVMGDFNATPWSAHFSEMTAVGKLRNARAGHGLHPTWPSGFFPLSIPIDHILVNSRIEVDHFESIYLSGSDHQNVLSRLRIY